MNALDVGTVMAILGIIFKTSQDKASSAESLGKMKQQIKSLETRMAASDSKLNEIDQKLGKLIASMTRLETLLGQSNIPSVLETPGPLKSQHWQSS